jgi:hypothetical protein
VFGCFKDKQHPTLETPKFVSKKTGSSRISLSDLSDYSSPSVMSDLSNSLVGSNLHIFTCKELKEITNNFNKSNFLGEGGFGKVYKGFIDDKLRPTLVPQAVAVKALNLDGKQGHREWLVRIFFLMFSNITIYISVLKTEPDNSIDSNYSTLNRPLL